MHYLFEKHTGWTDAECFYVVAIEGCRRAWLAGPYATRSLAEEVLPRAMRWAICDSGDTGAVRYHYRVAPHHHGHDRSILGEIQPSEWEDEPAAVDAAKKPYSVLLLYPDYANDSGIETYYAFVDAPDPIEAVAVAQAQAVAAQEGIDSEPADFAPLLVTEGHHRSEALFNQ